MNKKFFKSSALALILSTTFVSTAAFAADEAEGAWALSGTVGMVSDYRFRGYSLSDRNFAVQGSFDIAHDSGFYAGIWGSNLDSDMGIGGSELDLYAGYGFSAGGLNFDAGAIHYFFPDNSSDVNYTEILGSISTALGAGEVGVSGGYVFEQDNTGNADNTYIELNGSMPLGDSGISLGGAIGLEDGAFANDRMNWNLGLFGTFGGVDVGVSYMDTNLNGDDNAKGGLVLSLSKTL